MTILTAVPADPTGYGRVLRAELGTRPRSHRHRRAEITQARRNSPHPRSTPASTASETTALFEKLDQLDTNNAHGEFYLTDVAAMLVADGERVVAVKADSVDEVLGANTIAEMMHLDAGNATQPLPDA